MKNFNPRKALDPYAVLPSVRLCKKLPKEWFKHTYYVWYEVDGKWALTARELVNTFYDYIDAHEWYPCPTTEELFLKLPGAKLFNLKSGTFESLYLDETKGYSVITTGKTPAEALCKCFIEIYRKTKGK